MPPIFEASCIPRPSSSLFLPSPSINRKNTFAKFPFHTRHVYTTDVLTSFRNHQRRAGANLTSRFVSPLVHESENAGSGYTANLSLSLYLSLSLSSFVFFSPRAGKPISTRHPLSSYHLDFPLPQLVPSHFSLGFCSPWNNPVFGDNAYGDSS